MNKLGSVHLARRDGGATAGGTAHRYRPPRPTFRIGLWRLIEGIRSVPQAQYDRFLTYGSREHEGDEGGPPIFFAGDLDLVRRKCVAVVGARKVSSAGAALAREIAGGLARQGVVVVSGLAQGVDAAAHRGAIDASGRTVAVIGTPLDRAYPAANAQLQETIYREHLLVSPFAPGSQVSKLNFPMRNKFMAAISDATVIIEASDTSGTLHQASECSPGKLDRWLFISERVVNNPALTWPSRFLQNPKTRVFTSAADILAVLG